MNKINDFGNAQVAALAPHLKQYIVDQRYERYTSVDQAVWRYVMRQNYYHLKDTAYYPYIPGLKAAGLSIDQIPDLQQMNDALGKIGWGAVTVDGFIPPAAFMEFQSCQVLVIAADIRRLEHIGYTPAPDIIHESAGHAPIIADKGYQAYLAYFGSIGTKAIASVEDRRLYQAIRELSIIKEQAEADPEAIRRAEDRLAYCQRNMGEPSEAALLSRLHWWTVEYGLIGSLEEPKIYGAGLLSSTGESASCMQPEVAKLPYTIDALNYGYDITQPQPQLFVTPTFENLIEVLDSFADTMSFRRGGEEAMARAIKSGETCTAVYSSGLEVSGTFIYPNVRASGEVPFIRTAGPTTLCYKGQVITGHEKERHSRGFSSPVGKLKAEVMPMEYRHFHLGEQLVLHYECGILVTGTVKKVYRFDGKNVLITLSSCTVIDRFGTLLFVPSWGDYDLGIGESIVSVFGGAADKTAFAAGADVLATQTITANDPPEELNNLYAVVRNCREGKTAITELNKVWERLERQFPQDWLCALEIVEIAGQHEVLWELSAKVTQSLTTKMDVCDALRPLIGNGLKLACTVNFG